MHHNQCIRFFCVHRLEIVYLWNLIRLEEIPMKPLYWRLAWLGLLCSVFSVAAWAQDYSMLMQGDLTLDPADIDARATSPVKDQNDELCALIKVTLLGDWNNPLQLETGMVGVMAREEKATGEVWFWVPRQARNLSFKCKGYEPLAPIPAKLEKGKVYRLRLCSRVGTAQQGDPLEQLFKDMIYVEGGAFQMGANNQVDPDVYLDEGPLHTMFVKSYNIGKYEVTQAQWTAVMGSNPSSFKGDNLPVDNVSWDDIQSFIRKLNQQTGRTYRLPTEAEWEYAAKGGKQSKGLRYAGEDHPQYTAWYLDNAGNKSHAVGTKSPNELGLYDMCGNVWEWCQDTYRLYDAGAATDGTQYVLRGGSWGSSAKICRVTFRAYNYSSYRRSNYGFRLVLVK